MISDRTFFESPNKIALLPNEDYMQGKWNISSRYSGQWSARRSAENLVVDLQTRLEQQTSLTMT
jgi:hypothetical protein